MFAETSNRIVGICVLTSPNIHPTPSELVHANIPHEHATY